MTTGKAIVTLRQATAEIQLKAGTEPMTNVQPGADALQFAGLLLGASTPDGLRSILFTRASEGMPAQRMIHETALALRLIRNSRVAVVPLHESRSADLGVENTYLDGSLSQHWAATGDANFAVFYWNRSQENSSSLPASAFAELVTTLQQRFDFLLVDAGVVGKSPLPVLLAPYCTSTVLLVQPGITAVSEVQSSQVLLSQAQARLLGFAFVEPG